MDMTLQQENKTISFKKYDPTFIPAQYEMVFEIAKDWTMFNYMTIEQMEQRYGGDNFDHDFLHYAFDGDQMVGFLGINGLDEESKVANLQYPFVRPGYEFLTEKLVEHVFDTLRSKGMETVHIHGRTNWEPSMKTLESLGFVQGELQNNVFVVETKDIDYSDLSTTFDIVPVDPVADKTELIRVFKTEMPQTEEQIGQVIDRWQEATHVLFNYIVKHQDRIIAHSMVITNANHQDVVQMTHISIYEEDFSNYRLPMAKFILQKCKEAGYKKVHFILIPNEEFGSYDALKLPSYQSYRYSKKLQG